MSTLRSSTVERRFTNVVLARRRVGGSSCSVWPRATFSLPMAWAVVSGTLLSGGSAPFVNWAVVLEVVAANLVLFSEFLEETA